MSAVDAAYSSPHWAAFWATFAKAKLSTVENANFTTLRAAFTVSNPTTDRASLWTANAATLRQAKFATDNTTDFSA